jgi:hypothetical protein
VDLGLRTIVVFVVAGFISAFFPARLPMLFGPFFAGGCLGVLLAGYLWKAGDEQSWNLLALPGAFLVAFPFALVSGTGVLAFIDIVTRNSLDDGILDALVMFTIGASGAVPVFAAFILLRLREPIVSVLGPSLCFAIVPGIASVVVFYLADLKTGNGMITNPQPQLLVVWQTTVAGLLGYLEAEREDAAQEQQTEPPESVTQA